MARYEFIENKYQSIAEKLKEIKQNALEAALDEIEKKLPKNVKILNRNSIYTNLLPSNGSYKPVYCLRLRKYVNNNSVNFDSGSYGEISSSTYNYESGINVQVDAKDIIIMKSCILVKYSFKYPASLIKEIKEHNEVVEKFCQEFPDPISPAKISKAIKNKFTKEILKSSSPDFKKKLKAGFGITL